MTRVWLDIPPSAPSASARTTPASPAELDPRTAELLAVQERFAAHVRAHGLYVGHVELHPSSPGIRGDGPDRPRRPVLPTVTVLAWRDPADWLAWVESLPTEAVRVHRRPMDTTLVASPDHAGVCWRISGSLPRSRFPAWRVRPLHAAVDWCRTRSGRTGDDGWAPAADVVAAVRELLGGTA